MLRHVPYMYRQGEAGGAAALVSLPPGRSCHVEAPATLLLSLIA